MNNWQWNRSDERKDEIPPYSRVFIVCSKDLREDDLRGPFEKYGEIEDLYMPKDRNTGESKGVAYIKYAKTSYAAAAIQGLHLTNIQNGTKPIKVMVATNKNDKNDAKDEKYNRLFIKVAKQATDDEIKQHFSQFAHVESIHIQKDKLTAESKGLAYVQFKTFLDAAKAFEECDKKYRPVFASPPTPKLELKRGRDSSDYLNDSFRSSSSNLRKDSFVDYFNNREENMQRDSIGPLNRTQPQNYNSVCAMCSPAIPQKHLERLFNIVPGMIQCQYTLDNYNGLCKAVVTYDDDRNAAYCVERLNNFEYPSGEILSVKPNNPLSKAANDLTTIVNSFKNAIDAGSPDLVHLADAIAQASTLIKAATTGRTELRTEEQRHDPNYCSVPLPPSQPLTNINTRVAQRCFIVCKPHPPPINVLSDVFCRFGDLIDISTFPNKTFGFAKYASARAAQEAIKTLHGAVVCGVRLKVLEADEKPSKDDDSKTMDVEQSDCNDLDSRKRIKLHD